MKVSLVSAGRLRILPTSAQRGFQGLDESVPRECGAAGMCASHELEQGGYLEDSRSPCSFCPLQVRNELSLGRSLALTLLLRAEHVVQVV